MRCYNTEALAKHERDQERATAAYEWAIDHPDFIKACEEYEGAVYLLAEVKDALNKAKIMRKPSSDVIAAVQTCLDDLAGWVDDLKGDQDRTLRDLQAEYFAPEDRE